MLHRNAECHFSGESGAEAPQSKRCRAGRAASRIAKRLECGAEAPLFVFPLLVAAGSLFNARREPRRRRAAGRAL